MTCYHDGALHIFNLPSLTVVMVGNGVMFYHDYEGRHLWLDFPRWLSERICAQCGGIIWRDRCWRLSATYKDLLPLHRICAARWPKP